MMESNARVSRSGDRDGRWGAKAPRGKLKAPNCHPKFFPLPPTQHNYLLLANGSIFFPSVDKAGESSLDRSPGTAGPPHLLPLLSGGQGPVGGSVT